MANLVQGQQTPQQALTAARHLAAAGEAHQYLTFLLGAKIRADFIAGMGKIGGKFVIILDIQRVLSVDEIAALAGVREATVQGVEAT